MNTVPCTYCKQNCQTQLVLYVLLLTCCLLTFIWDEYSEMSGAQLSQRLYSSKKSAIISQTEYFLNPTVLAVYEHWHLALCLRNSICSVCNLLKLGRLFVLLCFVLFFFFSRYKCRSEHKNTESKFPPCKFTVFYFAYLSWFF